MSQIPGYQQQYREMQESLITSSTCEPCDEFQIIVRDALYIKYCINCGKEYACCFCNEICYEVTPGSITRNKYEYLTCENCDYLGIRCTVCRKLCKIYVSKNDSKLFWGCKTSEQCYFFKEHVDISLKNHVKSCKDMVSINSDNYADILCKFIFRYVDNLEFANILNKLYIAGKLNDTSLKEIKIFFSKKPEIVNHIENEIINYYSSPTTLNRNRQGNYSSSSTIPNREFSNMDIENKIQEKLDKIRLQIKTDLESKLQEVKDKAQENYESLETINTNLNKLSRLIISEKKRNKNVKKISFSSLFYQYLIF